MMHIRTIKEKYNYQKCFTSIQCVFRIILSQVDNQSNKNHKFNFSNSWLQKSWQLRNHFKLKLDGNYRRMDQDSMAAGNKETIMEVFYFSRNTSNSIKFKTFKFLLSWKHLNHHGQLLLPHSEYCEDINSFVVFLLDFSFGRCVINSHPTCHPKIFYYLIPLFYYFLNLIISL